MVRQLLLICAVLCLLCPAICIILTDLRGGLVPQASEAGGDYYEQFQLDYGVNDKSRVAGSLRGFIKSGNIASLPESDLFFKWINKHLEAGPEPITGRLKPFYVSLSEEKLIC